jgi:hypothetical protein
MCWARSIPALTRLPNGNLLMMVRVAEALRTADLRRHIHNIRWDEGRYRARCLAARAGRYRRSAQIHDPRRRLEGHGADLARLAAAGRADARRTRGRRIITTRRSRRRRVSNATASRMPAISKVGDRWLMTTCSVSPERHSTTLYSSDNGLDWTFEDIVLDHQNKDMLIFEGLIDGNTGRRRGRWATSISPIRPAANGARARRSTSRPRPTRFTGSRTASPASARIRHDGDGAHGRRHAADPDRSRAG